MLDPHTGKIEMKSLNDGFRLGYRPALDGLRGVSILLVMAFNAHLSIAQGGFIGVDIFFVLSGFLITRILVEEWERRQSINLKSFYVRRALRLLPALLLLVLFCCAYAVLALPREKAELTYKGAAYTLLYVANWVQAFNPPHGIGAFSPAWSLSVEEQFYVVWPLLLLGMLKLGLKRRGIIVVVLFMIVASFTWRALLWHGGAHYLRLYHGSDTRADALLIGCLAGLILPWVVISMPNRMRAVAQATGVLTLGLLIFGAVTLSVQASYMYYGGYTLVALGAALGIIAMIGFPPRLLSIALEYPALAWIGRISYSLYLWHFPVFEGLKGSSIAKQPLILHSAQFAGAFAFAILSYYLVERPFLRMKNRIGEKKAPSAGVSASGLNRELIGEHGAQA